MWRYWNIRPHWGTRRELSLHFYAPNVMTALQMARGTWPSADAWEVL